ncbi:N-acetylmuramoyl-L-alanine amidase family protein [Flavisolibacter tropicus]|uniref:N-acetylmuramoyl-L-alanine amidase family protein n=1 Tax=Flavisolibacter tropicus TaxID=1492898 RepID=UPI000835E19F|nr:N-acetylmuramoyl-L-alanine amidase [Flavisolibacter tropicus]
MLKKTLLTLSFFSLLTVLVSFTFEKRQKAIRTIIIDAGHGGNDVGARGAYSNEKDICLAVESKLAELIRKEYPEIKLIRTRPTDDYVQLHTRADIANKNHGDLFISIHVNSAPAVQHKEFIGNKTVVTYVGKGKKKKKVTKQVPQYRYYTTPNPAKGTETYIWGAHKNEDKEVAMKENAPMLTEDNYKQNYGDIDPNSPEFVALSLLKTKQFFKRSATLAGMVEEQFTLAGRTSRGQKQRQVGIWVLQATAMPSILVETGYISDRTEEQYLNSQEGQDEIARCVTNALKSYITWLEKQQVSSDGQTQAPAVSSKETYSFLKAVEQEEQKRKALAK